MNILFYIPLFIGIIFLLIGTVIKINTNKISRNSIILDGKVVDNVKCTMNNTSIGIDDYEGCSYCYFPIFEFTYGEQSHKIQYNIGSAKPKFFNGQSVKLQYNPDYPNKVLLYNDKFANNIHLKFWVIGILLTLIGIIVIKACSSLL